jgi:hypothetical protein
LNTEWNAIVNHDGVGPASLRMIPGAQAVSYFLSDGQPTVSSVSGPPNQNHGFGNSTGITGGEIDTWQGFLKDHDITSYALGVGSGATPSGLDPIAYDGRGVGSDLNGTVVSDLSQLTDTLVATVHATVIGSLIDGGVFASFGADGGYIKSIVVQNVDLTFTTYTYNPTTNAIEVTGGANHPTPAFDQLNKILTVGTGAGGTLTMDMQGPARGRRPLHLYVAEQRVGGIWLYHHRRRRGHCQQLADDHNQSCHDADGGARRLCGHQPDVDFDPRLGVAVQRHR